jgi:hypothetical protein
MPGYVLPPVRLDMMWTSDPDRVRHALDDDFALQLQDFSNTNPARGPVPGAPNAGRGGGRGRR